MFFSSPRKRQVRSSSWSMSSCETLETRQLLSAANCIAEPEAAAVALGTPMQYDPVGTWDFTVDQNPLGLTEGTAVITVKGKKVFAEVDFGDLDHSLKGKFAKDNPNLMIFKGKVKVPEVGKVKLQVENLLTSDTTFTGTFMASSKSGAFEANSVGTKQVATSSVPLGVPSTYDPVGSWEIFVGENPLSLTSGSVDVTAKGKKAFVAEGQLNGVEFSVVGKRQKDNNNLIYFKGVEKLPEIGKTKLFLDAELTSDSAFTGAFAAVNKKNNIDFVTSASGIKLGS